MDHDTAQLEQGITAEIGALIGGLQIQLATVRVELRAMSAKLAKAEDARMAAETELIRLKSGAAPERLKVVEQH